jgi:MFS family permease
MKTLSKLNLISFLSSLLFYTPIFALYFTNQGVSLSVIVIGQILYSVISMVAEIPTGYLTDKIGQRNGAILSYLASALGLVFALIFPNIIGVLLAFAFRGLGGAFESGSEEAIVYEHSKEIGISYTKAWGVFNSYSTFGFAVATFMAGLITSIVKEPHNLISVFVLSIVAYLVASIIAVTLKKYKQERTETHPQNLFETAKTSISSVKNNKTIFALLLTTILTWNAQWILYDAYQPYMIEAGVNIFFLGASLAVGLGLQAILLRYIDRLEKRFGLIKIIVLLNLPIGFLYILFSQVSSSPFLLVMTFILLQGFFGLHRPIISDFINSHLQSHLRAISLSAISFLYSLAKIILKFGVALLFTIFVVKDIFLSIGIYIIIGTLISAWNLKRCGCAYRFELYKEE